MFGNMLNDILKQRVEGHYRKISNKELASKFLMSSILNAIFGILSLFTFINIKQSKLTYTGDTDKTMFIPAGNLLIYIEIYFNQANLTYLKSINYDQLNGETNVEKLENLGEYGIYNGKPVYPAGKLPNSFLQDEISIENTQIDQNNIAYQSDIDRIGITGYTADEIEIPQSWTKNTNIGSKALNFIGDSDLPILNERFVNWIQVSLFYPAKKLWGTTNGTGDYENVKIITNNQNYKKELILTTKSWLGLKNMLAVFMFFALSIISLGASLLLFRIPELHTNI